jgi:transposase
MTDRTSAPAPDASRLALLWMVGASVGVQLACAVLLKYAVLLPGTRRTLAMAAVALVIFLNFLRFLIWNRIHKRYPVSLAYPLSAIFFPAVVLLAWATGEHVGAF